MSENIIKFSKVGLALTLTTLLIFLYTAQPTNHIRNASQLEAYKEFEKWIKDFGKLYSSQSERTFRFKKFYDNLKFIQSHNKRYKNGEETFEVGLNQFADMDNQEFSSLYFAQEKVKITEQCKGSVNILDDRPTYEDWSTIAVSSVKNQGLCTDAWAYAAVGALEGLAALNKGVVYNFSPQQLVDCTSQYGNQACRGGDMINSFRYVIDKGITTQQQYPYAAQIQVCNYTEAKKVFQNSLCAKITPNSTKALQSALIQQPVAVTVAASSLAFQLYRRGVFSGNCGDVVSHGMVLTGFGEISGSKYWKCKNSWGLSWGQEGYIFLRRTDEEQGPGQCGILTQSSVPLL